MLSFLYVYSDHSILESYNLFSGVELSMRSFLLLFRTIDDNRLHGSGRRLENTSEGIPLQITKKAELGGKLSCYLYIFQDAQINISDAQFLNVVY